MDEIKRLTEKKEMLNRLVKSATDTAELKALGQEIDAINAEIMDAKAEAKAEKLVAEKMAQKEKELEEKQVKEAQKLKELKEANLKVGTGDNYKGVNLKKASYIAGQKNPDMKQTAKDNPDLAERLVKTFTDMAEGAGIPLDGTAGKKSMTGGTGTAGGYLTATDERMEVVSYMRKSSIALEDCNVIQMSGDTMTFPKENGKVTVTLRGEGSAVTATSPTFTQIELATKNIDAYTDASKELVMDSDTLIATLMSQFVEAGGQALDDYVFTGTGSPMSGIFTAAAGYSEVFSSGSTNFSELLTTNVDSIIGKVLATKQDTSKLKWYGHPSVMIRYFQTLKDSNDDYLYAQNKTGTGVGNVLGYPVKYVYEATAASAAGGCMAVFGDLTGVYLGERLNNMSLFYDPYTDAANGNDRFFWYTRWAFNLAQNLKFGRIVSAGS